MDSVWATVDQLIHDLGAIRAFVDEAATVPEACSSPEVHSVRHAMNDATTAITRVFEDSGDRTIEDAWRAIARAQDAVREARVCVAVARAGRETTQIMAQHAKDQGARARAQARQLADQAERLRRSDFRGPAARGGSDPDSED